MGDLTEKAAIVTGASRGIGRAIAEHLAGANALVVVNYASASVDADRIVAGIQSVEGALALFVPTLPSEWRFGACSMNPSPGLAQLITL